MGGGDVTHRLLGHKLKDALVTQGTRKLSRQVVLERTLRKLKKEGGFQGAIIVSDSGLPLAVEGRGIDYELMGAIAAQIKRVAERGQPGLEEVLTCDADGNCMVSRYFSVGDDGMILVVTMDSRKSYRRLVGEAISEIRRIWEEQKHKTE